MTWKTVGALGGELVAAALAWMYRDSGGWQEGLSRAFVVWVVALAGFVVWAVARDGYTDWLAGGPEAPVCPDRATDRQRAVWRVLHWIDPIALPRPRSCRPPWGRSIEGGSTRSIESDPRSDRPPIDPGDDPIDRP